MDNINIDDYLYNDNNNEQINSVYQILDQSRKNNNQNNNDEDIPPLKMKKYMMIK